MSVLSRFARVCAVALTMSGFTAQSLVAEEQTSLSFPENVNPMPRASTQSWPFSFSGPFSDSSPASALALGFAALSIGRLLSDDHARYEYSGTYELFNYAARNSRYFDAQLGWYISQNPVAATYLLLGAYSVANTINSVTNAAGVTFGWDGDYKNQGVYLGYGAEWALNQAAAAYSVSSALAVYAGLNVGIGYGWNEVSFAGGGFTRKSDGMIGRVEAYTKIQVATNLFLVPAIVALYGPRGSVSQDWQTYALMRILYQF